MPDFTWPEVRLHSVNIREQFVAPFRREAQGDHPSERARL